MPQASNAEPIAVSTELICDDTQKITSYLMDKYNEFPLVIGDTTDNANSRMSIWTNTTTKTWTILTTKQNITCIIGVGNNLNIVRLGRFSG